MTAIDLITLLQNFHGFEARNIGMNKNGELAESKINLCLNQSEIKKDTMQKVKLTSIWTKIK